ncbi:DNA polymerase III subunit gamma/tau [Bifidobacterium sp. ESL0745]|uniref:DNA polymerase III subunit gamma/tau n=1 Tax=Bifidobacterium sp. ESL0745 TaxID=2983226 RepID=UPI0023FA3224|nr:DNA polymerase III subunit gamma/tau [Bifidobacterium sp. ESL0745]MDF7664535.1 DNA polymerase III subunit gamma/tau [Bifidobacterium sp. ESL0745]
MALALYRRYRPDTFDGIIGQDQVTVPLSRALDEGKLTHAYLFSGPRGCGKTSSARILARCINCAKGPTSHPCGECESCKDLATGGPGSIDVVEIDAASHNGVEDARELRERAAFAPARDRYKIFILDEAHMVTQQGFNALLKIVEEPPEHVMFIFATTEPDKVISTIRSRTHHYPFRLVPPEVMGPYLEEVCDKEHIDLEPGVLRLTMRAGGGSVRDTLSVLDQLMAGAVDNEVSYDSTVALLGFTPDELIGEAIDAVINKDGGKLYAVIEKVVVGGFEPRRFVEDLLSRVRDLLVLTLGGEKAEKVLSDDSAVEDMGDLHRQSSALGLSALTAMAEIINDTLGNMTGAISPRMRLELLAAKLLAGRESGFAQASSAASASGADSSAGQASVGSTGATGNQTAHGHSGFIGSSRNASNPQQGNPKVPAQGNSSAQGFARNGSVQTGQSQGNTSVRNSGPRRASGNSIMNSEPNGWQSHGQNENPQNSNPRNGNEQQVLRTNAESGSAEVNVGTSGGQSTAAATVGVDPNATVEEKWDAVLTRLPENVRDYVNHDKVTTVSLATNGSGKSRLSMTFDCALSQHAFALALASDAKHNGQKASNVVWEGVRSVFGPHTMIAPTAVAANGEKVISTKRMKPEELAKVKRDIAIAKVSAAGGLGMSSGQGGHAASEPKEHKKSDTNAAGEPDDSSHRRGKAESDGFESNSVLNGPDGAGPSARDVASQNGEVTSQRVGNKGIAPDAGAQPVDDPAPMMAKPPSQDSTDVDYDPWFSPLPAPSPAGGKDFRQEDRQAVPVSGHPETGDATQIGSAGISDNSVSPHYKKHVAVPDISDGVDPWATPATEMQPDEPGTYPNGRDSATVECQPETGNRFNGLASSEGVFNREQESPHPQADNSAITPNQTGNPADHGFASPNDRQPQSRATQDVPASNADDRGDVAARFKDVDPVGNSEQHPQVAAEDDDYSLSDQSLGDAVSIDFNELKKLFEVKKVETFKADDPKNPKNIKPVEKHPEEERR